MPSFALTWDRSQIRVLREQGLEKALKATLRKAGRDAIRTISTESSRRVRVRKRVRIGRVRAAFKLQYPRGSDIRDMAWSLNVKRVAIPLRDYPSRQTARGVSVAVNKAKRKTIPGAFFATMKSGHQGIFTRAGSGSPRLPIDELFSSTVIDVMEDDGLAPAVLERGNQVFGSSFARLLPLEIAKLK